MNKESIAHLTHKIAQLKAAIQQVIVGQQGVIDELIIGLIAGGHVLLEGVPGLAKTLMIKSLSQAMDLKFNRIQFTPDLMPSDILGTEILQEDDKGGRYFKFSKGPVFTNILLADEINRTPPKTQSALLELMQEYQLTYAGQNYALPKPFFLLATQNPIEQSGTFPLPEAQVDRFLLHITVNYPNEQEEIEILNRTTSSPIDAIAPVLTGEDIISLQKLCREVHIESSIVQSIGQLIRSTRPQMTQLSAIKDYVDWGAGPRAGQSLILAAKGHALLNNRYSVTPEDVKRMILPTLRHRVILNFKALSERKDIRDILTTLMSNIQIK